MIIALNGALKYAQKIPKTTIITRRQRRDILAEKQIIVSDVDVYKAKTMLGEVDIIDIYYNIGKNYLQPVKLEDEKITILVNLEQGFDLGIALYLLEKISQLPENKEVSLMAITPSTGSRSILARIYAWLMIIGFYDIFFNSRYKGSFRLIFIDKENPPQLISYLSQLSEKGVLSNTYSFVELRFKRYIVPVLNTRILLILSSRYAELLKLRKEYHVTLALIHYVLDKAPPDLWESIRSKNTMSKLRSVKYRIERIDKSIKSLESEIREIIKTFNEGGKYTSTLIDIGKIANLLLKLHGLKKLYLDSELILKVNEALSENNEVLEPVDNLQKKYPMIGMPISRAFVISKDLVPLLKSMNREKVHILEEYPGEILLFLNKILPICDQCISRKYYAELTDLRNSFLENIYNLQYYFPRKIYINDQLLSFSEFKTCQLVNYMGYVNGLKYEETLPCRNILDKIEKALI